MKGDSNCPRCHGEGQYWAGALGGGNWEPCTYSRNNLQPEDIDERRMFNLHVVTFGGVLPAIITTLTIWGRTTSQDGSFAKQCIIMANELRKLGKNIQMQEFKQYRRKQIAELRPWFEGEELDGVSISQPDRDAGSPKVGDMIARNPKNHADQWLVAAQYFADNFEPL